MENEDVPLIAAAAAAGLIAAADIVVTGGPRYETIALVLMALGAFLKALWPRSKT